ncbi:MAG: prephenate dehydrogenase/arogenate dehydrogenase family protein [Dehalococcoidia bacterium]|nr:prephenate dehydrogenase/arogenate dehydrogenase family protein [Dehalococcoidia bacterium]
MTVAEPNNNTKARQKIAIVGLGLIGGSIGLAIKKANLGNVSVVGYDRESAAMNKARRVGAVDSTEGSISSAVRDAACVIIAVPVMTARRVMEEIAPHLAEGAVVTDTGSTKLKVMEWAADSLPDHVSFVGGHPMAGKETAGIDGADADLFRDATYCVVPMPDAPDGAVQVVLALVNALGARPWFVDPEEHDRYAAAISHMPMVLANALFTMARDSRAWPELSRMVGPGFKDMTRLASQDPEMQLDIVITNREGIVHWIERMQEELARWKEIAESDEESVFQALYKANLDRDDFILNGPKEPARPGDQNVPGSGEQLADMLFGARMTHRTREITKFFEDRSKSPRRRER